MKCKIEGLAWRRMSSDSDSSEDGILHIMGVEVSSDAENSDNAGEEDSSDEEDLDDPEEEEEREEEVPGPSANGLRSKLGDTAGKAGSSDDDLGSGEGGSESDDDSDDDSDDSDESDGEKEEEDVLLPEVKLPKTITCDESILCLKFHPKGNMLAAGLMDGSVTVYSYSADEPNEELILEEVHKKACRAMEFSEDGKSLLSISKDKSICRLDIASSQVERTMEKAHESSIYSVAVVDENLIATGDDDGHLKVWDLRTEQAIMAMRENEEFISSLVVGRDKKILLATSGDGTLSAFNVRRRRFDLQSEHVNSELLCGALLKKGQKVVCGASDGALNFFNWGEFGNISDRFPGHSSAIDCCVPVTENVLCTGCIDGTIRAVHVLPNRFLGIVGDHGGLPVESLTVSHDAAYLASCAPDERIRFWGAGHLGKRTVDPRGRADRHDASRRLMGSGQTDNFFADL